MNVRRKLLGIPRRFREARMFARAMQFPRRPILAHIVPMRRCNLACAYCNEFDSVSAPVPLDTMLARIDRLAELGVSMITISGGEPLLHPDLDRIIAHIGKRGIIPTLITNGYLLTPERIRRLNRAGLHNLQISIDNVNPDEVSKKSLKVLDRKLQWLAEYAHFDVNVNAVVGSGVGAPEDALTVARRARELGLHITTGVIHDSSGQVRPLGARDRAVLDALHRLRKPLFSFVRHNGFQRNLMRGLPNHWHCRAGSRYLYVCEDGLVHWCSQQRGRPGIRLERYTATDIEREYHTEKTCAPFCTITCVHQIAVLDKLREKPRETISELVASNPPLSVRILSWLFLTSSSRRWFSKAALKLLRTE